MTPLRTEWRALVARSRHPTSAPPAFAPRLLPQSSPYRREPGPGREAIIGASDDHERFIRWAWTLQLLIGGLGLWLAFRKKT